MGLCLNSGNYTLDRCIEPDLFSLATLINEYGDRYLSDILYDAVRHLPVITLRTA